MTAVILIKAFSTALILLSMVGAVRQHRHLAKSQSDLTLFITLGGLLNGLILLAIWLEIPRL